MDAIERQKLLDSLRKDIGSPQALCLLGSDERYVDIKLRSSGSLMLDIALGGGYPYGRLVEISGAESAGKTTLVNLAIAEAQISEPDKECAIIDIEQSYNMEWAKSLGVDINRLFFSQPDTYAENIFEMIDKMIDTGKFAIIAVDSAAGLILKEEFEEGDWEKSSRVGGTAGLMTKAMRKLVYSGKLTKSETTLIFTNQLRDKIGGFSMYGTPTDTPCGRALKHTATQRLEVAKGQQFAKGTGEAKEVLGQEIRVKISKNKIAAPHRHATLDLYFASGVDRIVELVKVAKYINVLQGTSWLRFINPLTGEVFYDDSGNEIKFNGVTKAVEALKEDVTNGGALYAKIFETVNSVIRG